MHLYVHLLFEYNLIESLMKTNYSIKLRFDWLGKPPGEDLGGFLLKEQFMNTFLKRLYDAIVLWIFQTGMR